MITDHYGKWVNSEVPVTGVVLARDPEWLLEQAYNHGVDLGWEKHLEECQEEEHDFCEVGETFFLIGFRQDPTDGKYEPDPEAEYSVIIQDIYAQVVLSGRVSRAALCSPCFAGQADLSNKGEYLGYTLPEELWGDGRHLPIEGYERATSEKD